MTLPNDYLERVYSGILGKLTGVFLGRPFEGWTYSQIMEKLGPIDYYVHDRLNQPLVVTDDDVAGTFTFVRALEDYSGGAELNARDIGKAWLNYIVEERSILWWGGNGNSTEHTAWLNLKKGIQAPASGSIATNGSAVAEQIGAQIFIDGWALVAPGNPKLAARLARQAGLVSHDGESVNAAVLWAAMEAEAFRSNDIDHLFETGLGEIPEDSLIAKLVNEVRGWVRTHHDWRETRALIEEHYGYHLYPGNCHVVPNHALMVMAVAYAPHDFQRAQMIVNTSGWDTDCNAGNVGCLLGIMNGLEGLEDGPDWRGPLADRMLVSSADGGNSVTDAVAQSYYIANLGAKLAGRAPFEAPKGGAQFHFSLPGSVQGFRASGASAVRVANRETAGGRALAAGFDALGVAQEFALMTPTFTPPDVVDMRTYELMACPRVSPGQTLRAMVSFAEGGSGRIALALRLMHFDGTDQLVPLAGPESQLAPGETAELAWTIPALDGQPVGEVGLVVRGTHGRASGTVLVDRLGWSGEPQVTLQRPEGDGDFWRRAWINSVSFFSKRFPPSFRISQDRGEGLVLHGTREWRDYQVESTVMLHLGNHGGLIGRAQGLSRFYAVLVTRDGRLQLIRQRDEMREVLAEKQFATLLETPIKLKLRLQGPKLWAEAGGVVLEARDDGPDALGDGAIGLLVHEGALSTDSVTVTGL